ncbi:sensor histidine kinase [Limnohabitans sp. DCL3]|uniref:sensor histidine kinase n=1 Tax=Limnohabitans sp. DCL3 TaxID=3374103 RepID=UPI003A89F513
MHGLWLRCIQLLGAFWGVTLAWGPDDSVAAHAHLMPITHIGYVVKDDNSGVHVTQQTLPFFFRQERSGLTQVTWTFLLPARLAEKPLPAILLPQPVQGAVVTIGPDVIYELDGSNNEVLHNWYQPVLISVPRSMLQHGQDTEVRVTQYGHLRGWFISPMFAGDLQDLRPLFDRFRFIGQTLHTTFNVLSGLVGFFFVVMGLRVRSDLYVYGGMTSLSCSGLMTLALINELPTDTYFMWRMALYAITGMLIDFVSQFTFTVFKYRLPRRVRLGVLMYLHSGWVIYAWTGPQSEPILDVVWTGLAVCIYVVSVGWLVVKVLQQRQFVRVFLMALHGLLTALLAVHDYILHTGLSLLPVSETAKPLWVYGVLQPVGMAHLALPFLVVMAMWLLIQDHTQKVNNEMLHASALDAQRERMVNDIHDGVGARLNLLLWSLRTAVPSHDKVELELQRCLDELRFAINPSHTGHETLHQALSDLCSRLKIQAQAHGICLHYQRTGALLPVSSEMGLHLYKATHECLSNALRHSQATQIEVRLHQHMDEWVIEVRDNGTGIPDWDEVSQSSHSLRQTSLGLKSLYQRIESKGGQVHIASSSKGTCIKMSVPSGRTWTS